MRALRTTARIVGGVIAVAGLLYYASKVQQQRTAASAKRAEADALLAKFEARYPRPEGMTVEQEFAQIREEYSMGPALMRRINRLSKKDDTND